MRNDTHNPTALAILGYAGVIYAAVAVFVVTLLDQITTPEKEEKTGDGDARDPEQ